MRSAILLFVVACLSSRALADSNDHLEAAKAHYERGQTLYAGGQFAEARAEFLAGFELSHKPTFLFNAAECARLLGNSDAARDGYQQYLKLDPDGKLAQLAIQRLYDLGVQQPTTDSPPVVPTAPAVVTPPASPPITTASPPITTPTLAVTRSVPATSSDSHDLERYAGIGTAGVGVAMIVTGAFFGYKSSTLSNQVSGACTSGCLWSDVSDIDKYARLDATVQWWLYGLGAAAVVTGGVLYWHGSRSEHSSVIVAPTPHGAAMSWSGRF
ncbi:MAG TPA: tetratricopeptide repeat protein [Kofleriaceae bacterium]|nr:tetratricopeptide repeat protein [Kofleriaceae bacterium]